MTTTITPSTTKSVYEIGLAELHDVTIGVHVAPEAAIPAGAPARIIVAARPEEARDRAAIAKLDCVAPETHPGGPGPRRGAVVVLREGAAATRPRLRT